MEASNKSKNEISKIESHGGPATTESYINTTKSLEKLQLDRVCELKNGERWKAKKTKLQAKDRACITITGQLRKGQITTDEYVQKVIRIMREFR